MDDVFPVGDGTVVVSGFETLDERTGVVDRMHLYDLFDATGVFRVRRLLPMRFALINRERFRELAAATGFEVAAIYGDYSRGEYREEDSPYTVWVLRAKTSV